MLNQFKKNRKFQTASELPEWTTKSWIVGLLMTFVCLTVSSCATSPTTINSNTTASANINSNVATNSNVMAEGNANSTGVSSAAFATKEPPQYSLTMVVSGQGSTTEKQGALSPQTIEFARMDVDRRWAINVPSFGQIVYLEKPAMRYLILPSRNQYVELSPDALGFQLGNAMTPSAIIERLKPHAQTENLGAETVNGRAATKYRFMGEKDTHTQAGTVQSDSFVYVDDATGLPLRADLNFSSSAGAVARGTIETNNINLNPDAKLFEVPTTYKKVTAEELKQQVQSFIQFIRIFAPAMTQQAGATTPPAPQQAPTSGGAAATPDKRQ